MREGMLCGMWEGPLGISVAPGLPPACSPAVRSSSACSSSASVGVAGVSASWVGGGKNRDGMRVVDSHAKDAGGTFATDQEAC